MRSLHQKWLSSFGIFAYLVQLNEDNKFWFWDYWNPTKCNLVITPSTQSMGDFWLKNSAKILLICQQWTITVNFIFCNSSVLSIFWLVMFFYCCLLHFHESSISTDFARNAQNVIIYRKRKINEKASEK